ncbi:hypothetical protein MTO96_048415 [Rhipicephalus appendiculatus]
MISIFCMIVRPGKFTEVNFSKYFHEHGRGRAPGFNGRVLQLTGTLRLTGVRPLDYPQDDSPTTPMEVVQGMEAAATSSTSGAHEPPAAAAAEVVATPSEREPPAAPLRRRLVRPPRQPRARHVDVLSDMQSQCASSLEQGTDLLRVVESISSNMRRLALAAEESTALLRRSAEAVERAASAQEAILRELREGGRSTQGTF